MTNAFKLKLKAWQSPFLSALLDFTLFVRSKNILHFQNTKVVFSLYVIKLIRFISENIIPSSYLASKIWYFKIYWVIFIFFNVEKLSDYWWSRSIYSGIISSYWWAKICQGKYLEEIKWCITWKWTWMFNLLWKNYFHLSFFVWLVFFYTVYKWTFLEVVVRIIFRKVKSLNFVVVFKFLILGYPYS